jgi:hypothetical protein
VIASKLTPKLSVILDWCQRNPTRRRREPLAGGLVIAAYLDHTGLVHLLLSRKGDKGPSNQECRTVLAHWPEAVPAGIQWTAFARGQFQCCVAIWRPALAAEQLPLESHAA